MNRLKEKYIREIIPAMREKFGYRNNLSVPKLEKVTLNVGIASGTKDPKVLELAKRTLGRITGLRPIETKARKSISNFKIREGMKIGVSVTLRGERMYEFTDKLVSITLPRVRDFRGLQAKSFDKQGNMTIGFKEHIIFPEINPNEVESLHGLEVSVVTTAKTKEEGLELLKLMGFPFRTEN